MVMQEEIHYSAPSDNFKLHTYVEAIPGIYNNWSW